MPPQLGRFQRPPRGLPTPQKKGPAARGGMALTRPIHAAWLLSSQGSAVGQYVAQRAGCLLVVPRDAAIDVIYLRNHDHPLFTAAALLRAMRVLDAHAALRHTTGGVWSTVHCVRVAPTVTLGAIRMVATRYLPGIALRRMRRFAVPGTPTRYEVDIGTLLIVRTVNDAHSPPPRACARRRL